METSWKVVAQEASRHGFWVEGSSGVEAETWEREPPLCVGDNHLWKVREKAAYWLPDFELLQIVRWWFYSLILEPLE